jgi:trigger factor
MNITREDTGTLTATIRVTINKEDYEENVTKTLREQQRKAVMPGFRPGKVPFGLLKKMYGKSIIMEEVNHLLTENLAKFIQDNNLKVIGNPLPNKEKTPTIDLENEALFDFYFDIGMSPDFDLSLPDQTPIVYYEITADDKMVDNYIKDLQLRHGGHSHPETTEYNNVVQGELIELNPDGTEKPDGIKHKTAIAIDLVKDEKVKSGFIGLKKDDQVVFNPMKATQSAVDAAYMLGITKELAEKNESDFRFTIEEILRQEMAELNDDFFKKVFPESEIKDISQFREKVKEAIERSLVTESDRYFINLAIETLVEKTALPLPDDFIKRTILENDEEGITKEDLDSKYDNYAKALRWQLIESRIIKDHSLNVEEIEMRDAVRNYFTGQVSFPSGDEESEKRLNKIINSVLDNKEESGRLHDQIFDRKLMDLFKSTLKLNRTNISYDDFVNLVTKKNK